MTVPSWAPWANSPEAIAEAHGLEMERIKAALRHHAKTCTCNRTAPYCIRGSAE